MTSAELGNLVRIGKLKVEPPPARELAGLLDSARVGLADAASPALAFDSRFDLAYNASHALALYALRRANKPLSDSINHWLQQRAANKPDADLSAELLWAVAAKYKRWCEGADMTSRILATFVARLASVRSARSVLDPTCGSGALPRTVADSTGAEIAHGVDVHRNAAKLASLQSLPSRARSRAGISRIATPHRTVVNKSPPTRSRNTPGKIVARHSRPAAHHHI
jgi:hypothetical protein